MTKISIDKPRRTEPEVEWRTENGDTATTATHADPFGVRQNVTTDVCVRPERVGKGQYQRTQQPQKNAYAFGIECYARRQ